jgi:hypothetical protein
MNMTRLFIRLAAASLLAAAAAACGNAPAAKATPAASGTPAGPANPAAEASVDVLRQIREQAADLSCDVSQQCHTLPLGAKPCGGPEGYLPWSSKNNDGAALRDLAARHTALRRAENARSGMLSTCSVTPDPGATCRAGRCVLQAPRLGGGTVPAE